MDSAKKKTFHHTKKTEDDDEKKARVHPEVEEVEETEQSDESEKSDEQSSSAPQSKSELSEQSEESESKIEENTPIRVEADDNSEKESGGPKINFDYPQNQSRAFSQVQKAPSGSTLDELADGSEEEYDQSTYAEASVDKPNQPASAGSAQRPNPYAQQPQEGDLGIKSIRQPQSGPNFPAPQNMNGNGNRPPNQFSNPAPGGFNFRREGNNYRSNSNSKIYFVLLLVIGLVVLGGAVYVLKNQLKPAAPKPSPSPEVTITTPEPSATPEALDRSQFTIRVLNGSGKTGLAAEVADKLKALGYKIEKTANATNSAFPSTLVRTQTNDASLSAQLIKDMSDQSYEVSSGSTLKKGDTSNAEIILGAK